MSKKIQLKKASKEIIELAKNEIPNEPTLRVLGEVFEEVQYGTIEINVVAGEIENVKVTKNYKTIELVD